MTTSFKWCYECLSLCVLCVSARNSCFYKLWQTEQSTACRCVTAGAVLPECPSLTEIAPRSAAANSTASPYRAPRFAANPPAIITTAAAIATAIRGNCRRFARANPNRTPSSSGAATGLKCWESCPSSQSDIPDSFPG